MKRFLILALFVPTAAMADDTQITVVLQTAAYRVRPDPKQTSGQVRFVFHLREDGSIREEFERGKRAKSTRVKDERLGEKFRVVSEKVIQRKKDFRDRVQTMTITVNGSSCSASMTNVLKPGFTEWKGTSEKFGSAYFRDWQVTSSTCTIK